MLHLVENLQFKANIEFVTDTSPCFKSLDYPPKDDFVMSVNQNGEVISRYGDDIWDFSLFGCKTKFYFKDFDESNKGLFKQLMYYVTYSHLFPGKYDSLAVWYFCLQRIFGTCSQHNIIGSDLSRFPKVVEEIANSNAKNAPSQFKYNIFNLDLLLRNQEQIGFTLLNKNGIATYRQFYPEHENEQTPYIPNLIWTKFIQYFDSVLDDFDIHQEKLETLFHYFVEKTLSNEEKGVSHIISSPFNHGEAKNKVYYEGSLNDYLKKNGLMELFERYLECGETQLFVEYTSDHLGALLNNIVISCYLYILYYSIMRKQEAAALRIDCLQTESDERFGEIYLLAGETTKTDPDSDARWVVPKRVKKAIRIAKTLVEWKLQYVPVTLETPHLFQNVCVWIKSNRTSKARNMKAFQDIEKKQSRRFFKLEQFVITQEDYDQALALTPSLVNKNWFKVGGVWKYNYHQFRRTLAVHFALNKISVSSTQLQMKHGTREQQFYYQNNAGRLRINHSAEELVVNEYYAEMSRNIASVVSGEAILPHVKSPVKPDVVCFITQGEKKKLLKAQKNGSVGYRKNILGGCMKQGVCEYGGFDSIAPCSGGGCDKPCSDLIIDGTREQEFIDDKAHYEMQIDNTPKDSPRYRALKAEVEGYETVLNIIENKKGV